MVIANVLGLATGFSFVVLSKPITLKVYNHFGITRPVCDGNLNCVYSALFDCSLYILAILGVIGLALGFGLLLKRLFDEASKGRCKYCGKELGQEYHDGNCVWKEQGDIDLWAHKKCVPKRTLNLWTSTEE